MSSSEQQLADPLSESVRGNTSTGSPERHLRPEFIRYFMASLAALALDTAVLLSFAQVMHYTLAACLGFLSGSFLHYLLSTRWVFNKRSKADQKLLESGIFILAGALGLAVNVVVIWVCVEWFDLHLAVSKMLAAGLSFLVGYAGRKWMLFS